MQTLRATCYTARVGSQEEEGSIRTRFFTWPGRCLPGALGALLCAALVTATPAAGQDELATDALRATLAAADQAAREFDYEAAISLLSDAEGFADEAMVPRLRARQALYERYLGMWWLVEQAADNPGRLVGLAVTRGGRQLAGLIQLVELGVTPTARIGNRLLDRGRLGVRTGPGEIREVAADDIALLTVTWARPRPEAAVPHWTLKAMSITLHTGEAVQGAPSWVLPISSLAVRAPATGEETTITVLPASEREYRPEDFLAEVVFIGAPAPQTPSTETEESP